MVSYGFDIAKSTVVVVRTDASHELKRSWTLENTDEAISTFLEEELAHYSGLHCTCEATAEYHRPLARSCLALQVPLYLLNPIVTKQFTKATVRKKKTDLSDAHTIARLGLQKTGTLVIPELFAEVKPIVRTARELRRLEQSLLLMGQRLAEVLPEHPDLQEELSACHLRVKQGIKAFDASASACADPGLVTLLQSLPGVGKMLAPVLIAEIGDIGRFPSGKALVAFAGLDPKVKQSGLSLNRNTKLTKRGSPYLRRALFLAAGTARRVDPELKDYYEKKRAEGKRYTEAVVATARKLTHRTYAVWKRGVPYEMRPTT